MIGVSKRNEHDIGRSMNTEREAMVVKDLRRYQEYVFDHKDFESVDKSGDWNVAILRSPPSTKTRETYNGRNAWFFKVSDEVKDRLLLIKWQDKHNQYVIGSTKIPTMDLEQMVTIYERFEKIQ